MSTDTDQIKIKLLYPTLTPWESIRRDIMAIENAAFGEKADTEETLKNCLTSDTTIAVLLFNKKNIVGYSYAIPDPKEKSTNIALVDSTALLPAYQGKGLVVMMNRMLETELIKKFYEYFTVRANVANGYAGKIQKNYADQIVECYDLTSALGEQRYFKIKLK